MAAAAEKLTVAEFEAQYANQDRAFEFWYGEVVPKGMPTWIHGALQFIVMRLLNEAGYGPGSEIELRIVPDARPRPDVIATIGAIEEPYPTRAVDVVVEILSEDDSAPHLLEKCRAYQTWGFEYIYVVDPMGRQLFRWTGSGLALSETLTTIPASRIWEQLDRSLRGRQ